MKIKRLLIVLSVLLISCVTDQRKETISRIDIEFTDSSGKPVTALNPNYEYKLKAYI